jgi:Ca2+-binding EF-hand superfamily protein
MTSLQINRFSLADGLAKLGYKVSDSDLDHLLAQLATVPGLSAEPAVSEASFAASQLDWESVKQDDSEQWRQMGRAAFDALDLDGDGKIHRMEMEVVLAGRCPENVCFPSYTARLLTMCQFCGHIFLLLLISCLW